jgi:hypothetical protein
VDAAAGLIDDGGGHGATWRRGRDRAQTRTSWEVVEGAVAFHSG